MRKQQGDDRRASTRFAIEREVVYTIRTKRLDETGRGQTVNMSSNGVLFTIDRAMNPGWQLELSIDWPARLNNTISLKLVASGRVIRYEQGLVAMEIRQYEFRTTGNKAGA